jgi:hypothetical protein
VSPISPAERERVVQRLAVEFAQDRLTLEEYERRVTEVYRAQGMDALSALTRDLVPVPAAAPAVATAAARAALSPIKRMLAFMSGIVRRGAWLVPPDLRVMAVMGGVDLDLREATFTAPVTEVHVLAVLGGVSIKTPPHVRVDAAGSAFLGGFDDHLKSTGPTDPSAPVVRIRGFAVLGGVEVKVAEVGDER